MLRTTQKFVISPPIVVAQKISNSSHVVHKTFRESHRFPHKTADPLPQDTVYPLDETRFPRLFFTAKWTSGGIAPL